MASLPGSPDYPRQPSGRPEFDEPFLVESKGADGAVHIETAIADAGYRRTSGGHFFHITGANDKGRAAEFRMRSNPLPFCAVEGR
jgi:hypothetical protein